MPAQNVLVINCGSSSLKFALLEPQSGRVLQQGLAERVGTDGASLELDGVRVQLAAGAGHARALDAILDRLDAESVLAVGHRVVHGGEAFSQSVLLDDQALERIRGCSVLAPLHNPANVLGIEIARGRFPKLAHVAVFDTAFHQTMPPKAYFYALPYELYAEHGVRRYGFHGSSHGYVAGVAAERLGRPLPELELVTVHLGNGCSACAIQGGRSVDTTMGLTPLEGLVMGTRSGDVDPNLHLFLSERTGQSLAEVTELLNRRSGLLGLSGLSNDMRTLLESAERGEARSQLAIAVFCYRLAKSILGLCAGLARLDALVFTGGIGEHAASIRADTLAGLRLLGPVLDADANGQHGRQSRGRISRTDSALEVLVIPTNEELVIAREAARLAGASLSSTP
jgi:acetate kinase